MAVWQYDVVVIPKDAVKAFFHSVPRSIRTEEFDLYEWWTNSKAPNVEELSSLFPRAAAWSESIKAWGGSDDEHRIELHYGDGRLLMVRIRLDLRETVVDMLQAVVRWAKLHDYLFWSESQSVLEPTIEDVVKDIKASRAFSFVCDPIAFLEKVEKEGGQ
ncbi:MAG: hypothetical protein HYX69_05260 [Planctomycetia bacterium]|nr:hypothetical protein [Planctomycetia bacterium]